MSFAIASRSIPSTPFSIFTPAAKAKLPTQEGQDNVNRRAGWVASRHTWSLLTACTVLWSLGPVPASAQITSSGPTSQSNPSDPAAPVQGPQNPAAPPPPPPSFASVGPISFSGAVTADLVGVPSGGISPGLKVLTKTAVSAAYDGSSGPLPGWTAQATLQFVHGGHPSAANVGDIQGVDNIEAPNALKLYEFWIARQWANGAVGVKIGLTDLNVDFDTQQVAALFLNSSDGVGGEFGHSGLNGPSIYPTTTLAVSGFWKPDDNWTLRAGVFDGVAGSPENPGAFLAIRSPWDAGLLVVAQAERQLPGGVRAELGGWAYTAGFDALHEAGPNGNPLHLKRDRGLYGLVEGPLLVGDHSSLAGWVRAGIGDPVVQRISGYVGLGLVASGLIPSRREDQAGFSINHAIVDDPSSSFGGPSEKHAETAFEITYKTQVRDWLAIQPDIQYVVRPNGDPQQSNALVLALRFSIALTQNFVRQIPSIPQAR